MKEIAGAFVKAQKAFGPALKTHTNPAFRSKYADLSACIEAVVDALNSNGIALMQHCHEVETGVTVETIFIHESGETLSSGKLHVPASKQDPQGYGSALTYARRYSLMAACGIAPEDDDGNAGSRARAKPEVPKDAPLNGAEDAVDIETRTYLRDMAMELVAFVRDGKPLAAYERVQSDNLDDVQTMALWSMLDAKTRGAIKAAKPKATT